MGVAIVAREDAQKQRPQHVAGRVGPIAFVAQGRVRNERFEAAAGGQKLGKKHERTQRADRQVRHELRLKTPAGRVHDQRLDVIVRHAHRNNAGGLTRRVRLICC